jgi:acyl-CoA synthetase (AMP-forming)/AMP-acid ligase II
LKTEELQTFIELVRYRALSQPEDIAYRFLVTGDIDGDIQQRTFRQLERRARAIAAWLQENEYADQHVLLLHPPGLDCLEAFLGCLFAGSIAVPAFPPRSIRALPRIAAIIAQARPKLVLTTAEIAQGVQSMSEFIPDLAALTYVVSADIEDGLSQNWSAPEVNPESIAFLQYTSGSTSHPKGVMISHGNLLSNQLAISKAFNQTPEQIADWRGDIHASWLPLQHDMGLIGFAIQSIYVGKTTSLMSPLSFIQKPVRWLQVISHFGAHASGGPNFGYDLCVQKINLTPELIERLDLSHWTEALNGAEPVRWETLERFAKKFEPTICSWTHGRAAWRNRF